MGVPRKKLRRAEKIEQARSLGHYPDRKWSPLSGTRPREGELGGGMLRAIARMAEAKAAKLKAAKPKRARKPKAAAPQPAA